MTLRDKRFTELTTDLGSVVDSNFGEIAGPLTVLKIEVSLPWKISILGVGL